MQSCPRSLAYSADITAQGIANTRASEVMQPSDGALPDQVVCALPKQARWRRPSAT